MQRVPHSVAGSVAQQICFPLLRNESENEAVSSRGQSKTRGTGIYGTVCPLSNDVREGTRPHKELREHYVRKILVT